MQRHIICFFTAAIACLASLPAQLSGTYTINNAVATGGSNFASFVDATGALTAQGVSGAVTFLVLPGTGPYGGFAIGAPITGASASNRITFAAVPGPSPVVSGPAGSNLQTIKLGTAASANSGPGYITIRGLTVQGAPSGAAILCAGCTGIVIEQCLAQNCGAGIYFVFTTNSYVQDNEVHSCAMTPGTPGANNTYVGGITMYSSANSNWIQRNRVHDCTGNGLFLGAGGSATAQVRDCVVVNNFVWNCPGLSTYPGGIALRRITGSTVSNNSVVMPASSANAGLHIQAAILNVTPPVGPAAEISNNVIQHLGSGACVAFDVTTAVVPTIFDNNHYDAAGTGPVGKVGATVYATLAAWQAVTAPSLAGKELTSIAAPAGFVSATDLHITAASAAFDTGTAVALAPGDIDQTVRPIGSASDRGAHEVVGTGFGKLFGWGCDGAAGRVLLTSSGTYQSASSLTLVSTNHAASAPGVMIIGISNSTSGSLALPYQIDGLLGTSACFLNVSPDLTLNATTSASSPATLTFTLPVPATASGATVHFQHLCLEAVPGGLSASNGVTVKVQ